MTGSVRGERPAAGTEAQATALLGWLTAPDAPRLCLVTGGPRRGKSALLAWFAAHGGRPGARRRRSTRELIPLAGQSTLGTAWTIANRLGVVARTPGELVQVLATTEARRAVLVLTDLHEAAEPEGIAELFGELSELGRIRLAVEVRADTPAHSLLAARRATVVEVSEPAEADGAPARGAGRTAERFARPPVDLADPRAVCAADPLLVTTGYTGGSGDDRGGLRSAWLRAGQSLCRDQEPAGRALVLLGALGDGADPRLRPALRDLAADAAWRVRWTRVRGDLTPPWPGPVTALGTIGDRLLVAGPTDAVHLLRTSDGTPAGQTFASPARRIKTLAPAPDGTLLLLDERGRLHTVRGLPGPRPPYLERLTAAVAATLTRHPGTALAAISGSVVVGDRLGSVHAFGLTGIHQAALHSGRVTAVTAVEAPPTPFLCSGGLDGTVRLWTPGQDPHPEPLVERPCPVVALHAAPTADGPSLAIAWADGLIELHHLDTKERLTFRPGPPVRAVVIAPDGGLVAGMDEALLRLDEGTRQRM
ncbi:WD40 repeat domain-containing protein [Streptomyces sp. NPDC047971]|uniref:WD40 repeat domain-containing protein n=1 Tax=Streptomyces sp. NPDC047971 TaxID=3154499 RepID=UPI0033E6421B